MAAIDRIETLHQHDDTVGLDFVYVSQDQKTLYVFFHPAATLSAQQILGPISPAQIAIYSPSGGERLPIVPLDPVFAPTWVTLFNRRVLKVVTTEPGDFSRYRFRLHHPAVDPYFEEVGFSFKANCPSQLDCEAPPHECPEDELVDYPVNYQARDFWSIRQALLDFASERHPDWKDRLEADLGMMLAEVMSAMGDEFAYYQDRISREAFWESATQRRAIRRHTRLVDYTLQDGKAGTTWLDFAVDASQPVHVISAGLPVWVSPLSVLPNETAQSRRSRSPSVFEVGHGLAQGHAFLAPPLGVIPSQSKLYPASTFNLRNGANEMEVYQWDDSDDCLPLGSTVLYVKRTASKGRAVDLPLEDFTNPDVPGKWVVLKTNPNDASVPARTWLVRLIQVTEETDPLTTAKITRLEWEEAQATTFELELESLVVRGNIVPATAGETLEAFFQIEPNLKVAALPAPPPPNVTYAIERQGPAVNTLPADTATEPYHSSFLLSLPGSEDRDVVSHGFNAQAVAPEARVMDGTWAAGLFTSGSEWEWKRSLLGVNSSQPSDKHFTLDDGSWRRVAAYRRVDETGTPQEHVHSDYANGRGATIRFGNGEFGETPGRGTHFRVVYRLGRGRGDNVAAGSLTDFNPVMLPFVLSLTNPLPVLDAVDPETPEQARHVASQAFRAETFRAVREEDYAAAVEKLSWVQRAGAQFRWTGSWLTLFATPDPKGSFSLTPVERLGLEQQLDRYRLAGRETHGMNPKFANLDLQIHICVAPTSYVGEVKLKVLEALFGRRGVRPQLGFFSPDNWTFGDPLDRAQLEAAIQAVPGVRAVEEIYIRRRGWFALRLFDELVYAVAPDEIIRVENNPQLPERGAVRLVMEGGA
jgi:hypothetical protein